MNVNNIKFNVHENGKALEKLNNKKKMFYYEILLRKDRNVGRYIKCNIFIMK
jgi:hypothetical protein